VTIRDFVRRLLDRGADDADPDELVELVVLKLPRGPMVLSALQAGGIDAVGDEAFDIVTKMGTEFRIRVPRNQVAAANAILDDAL
jgi:hypothetical protein